MLTKLVVCLITIVPFAAAQSLKPSVDCDPRTGALIPGIKKEVGDQSTIAQPSSSPGAGGPFSLTDKQPDNAEGLPNYGRQTKRILYIVPNFTAISAGCHLPPETAKEKLRDATQDTFDYSNWVFIGIVAGVGQAERSIPEFGQGGVGYGRYYWHAFVDQGDENYIVEGILPIALRQDTRYYTLGYGGFFRRAFYAISRGVATRSNAGRPEPNYSEIVGAGGAAGISNLYYPEQERTWTKTGQRWATNFGLDVLTLSLKEFWPDVNRKVLHQ